MFTRNEAWFGLIIFIRNHGAQDQISPPRARWGSNTTSHTAGKLIDNMNHRLWFIRAYSERLNFSKNCNISIDTTDDSGGWTSFILDGWKNIVIDITTSLLITISIALCRSIVFENDLGWMDQYMQSKLTKKTIKKSELEWPFQKLFQPSRCSDLGLTVRQSRTDSMFFCRII